MATQSAVRRTPQLSRSASENIRVEAARRRHSQSSLARALGMSVSSVNSRYLGETPWTLDEVQAVAELFGVRPADLLECAIRDSNPEPSDMDTQDVFALVLGVAA